MSVEEDTTYRWAEYHQEFPELAEELIRPGCRPRKLLHGYRTEKAIVLVHGLTDSPFYMSAIAEYFHHALGYNVYLPLLQAHGLKDPQGMSGVSLAQWKKNVLFALHAAGENGARVSIGGLSTGGALSLYFGCKDPGVTGDIYLFSAALGLYGGHFGMYGGFAEILLRLPFVQLLDSRTPLVGRHRYRYDRVPLHSAGELAKLIAENDQLLELAHNTIQAKRIFAAWSEFDHVISVRKLQGLKRIAGEDHFCSFVIPRTARVAHPCVVLEEPLYAIGSQQGDDPLEAANPLFSEMMAALGSFESSA